MKFKIFTLSFLMVFTAVTTAKAQRSFGSDFGASVNVGLTGIGATGSVSLSKYFTGRVGFGVMPFSYTYTMDELSVDLSQFNIPNVGRETIDQDIDLKAKIRVPAAHVLVDYNPFKDGFGAFHITAGLYMGGSKLVHVKGSTDIEGLRQRVEDQYPGYGRFVDPSMAEVEIGDVNVRLNHDGSADAYAKVNSVRPYLGVGWGNAIPKKRFGFRFDIGAMYHGKPEITSPNADGDLMKTEDAKDFNKIISKVQFWPQLSFQATFRILKDKQ